ncbi:MAG TPA: hypothetical protein VKF81_16570 [Blastocatellia bacterium]|nr:hypothetical protein [Blastocatellia bacterium]
MQPAGNETEAAYQFAAFELDAVRRVRLRDGKAIALKPKMAMPMRPPHVAEAADAGVPLNAIRDVMGHKTTAMTERYAHATDEGKRRAVEAVQSVQR